MCQIQYNVETDSYIVMGRSTGYRMAMGKPVINDIIDMEKVEPGILSKLLDKFRQMDDAYAGKVRQIIMPKQPDGSMMSVARSGVGAVLGAPVTRGLADVSDDPRMINQVAKYAIPAASIGARYVMPAVALKGVADLTGDLYDATSEVEIF